jgi:hypothetical protein
MIESINWTKIELKEPVSFKEEGLYFNVKILKNIKGRVMAEVNHMGAKMMRPFDFLPNDVQVSIKKNIAVTA